MKIIKILAIVLLVVFLIIAGWLGYAWYTLTHPDISAVGELSVQKNVDGPSDTIIDTTSPVVPDEPITITSDSLTEGQQELLEKFGLDEAEITITPKMAACAEEKLGTERIQEITAGASPTPFEVLRLAPCIR